ncbi:MAG: RNA polymerase sigma factor [Mangrovibacterium sp.]
MSQTIFIKYKRAAHDEKEVLEGLYQQKEWAVRWIYQTQYKAVKKMVYTFRNTRLDPRDVFQEGLIRALLNIRLGKFRGDSSFATYLNSICYNICLKELNRNKEFNMEQLPVTIVDDHSNDFYELLNTVLMIREKLNKKCQNIIDLRFRINHIPADEPEQDRNRLLAFDRIAQLLGISPENARQRFIRCLKQLKELAYEEPIIREQFNSRQMMPNYF